MTYIIGGSNGTTTENNGATSATNAVLPSALPIGNNLPIFAANSKKSTSVALATTTQNSETTQSDDNKVVAASLASNDDGGDGSGGVLVQGYNVNKNKAGLKMNKQLLVTLAVGGGFILLWLIVEYLAARRKKVAL